MVNTDYIYLACGATDFRKQVDGLVTIINSQFKLDPFADTCALNFVIKK